MIWNSDRKEKNITLISIVLCIAVFLGDILINMVPLEGTALFRAMHIVMTACCLAWVTVVYYKREKKYVAFALVYLAWLVLTRMVHGDVRNSAWGELCCAAEMCIALRIGCALNLDEQRKFLKWFTVITTGILTLWAMCGLVVILTDITEIPLFEATIHLTDEFGILCFLQFFTVHRNESAAWFMVALWLTVVQCAGSTKRIWKVLWGLDGLIMYLMIATQHCRSVYVATAVGSGLLVFAVLMGSKRETRLNIRMMIAAVAALACIVVVYKGFSICNRILASEATAQTQEVAVQEQRKPEETVAEVHIEPEAVLQETTAIPGGVQQETAESNNQLTDQRNFWNDLRTLTMRTEVWGAVVNTLKAHPEFLLWGQPEDDIPLNLQRYGGMTRPIGHTHNMFVQALSLAGIPGLVLLFAFAVCAVWNIIRCYFSKGLSVKKLLVIPLVCLMIYGIMEPLCSNMVEFGSVCYMLIAGMIVQKTAA